MRILLDHCVDWRLRRSLPGHDVKTTREMGWDQLKNGRLLAAAGTQFDVIVTVGQKIKMEQNLATLPISVVVLIAFSNRLNALLRLVPALDSVLSTIKSNQLVEISTTGITIVV